jgi:hypothetical protein
MSRFNSNESSRIARQISESVERQQIGRVVEVFEHVVDDDKSNFEVDVELIDSRQKQFRAIPWQQPQSNEIKVPKVGDKVIVEYRGQSKKIPIARSAVNTSEDRPPKGRAGVWRRRVESGDSPAGSGDLYIESFTEYDQPTGRPKFSKDTATPETSYIRIGKKEDDLDDPTKGTDVPMFLEVVDSPKDDDAHIRLELNRVDGSESTNSWGLELDVKTGEFKLLDGDGYGLVSDGSGNIEVLYETFKYNQGATDSL